MECRVRVRGHLDPAWGDRLGGLRIAHEASGCSLLAGPLPDQAALHGVLLQLIRLGLPLLALETRDCPRRGRASAGSPIEDPAGAVARWADSGGEIDAAPTAKGGRQLDEGQG